jgi:uncharacterized membrane protein YkvA (DUF1232 family)
MFDRIKLWARELKRDAYAVYLAARDPRTPWYVKALAAVVAAYAFSPIDLIPDFIPIVGYLDDLILVPLGIWLVVSLIPEQAMAEYRARRCWVGSPFRAGADRGLSESSVGFAESRGAFSEFLA